MKSSFLPNERLGTRLVYHVTMFLLHRLLDWRERRSTATQPKTKYDKVVIFRHAFHPKEFEVSILDH